MAIFRQVHIDFWQDGFVIDLTPEEKYFYLFLLTNSKTKQCGIYELPLRIIETETGYNRETVNKLMARFEEYNKIVYDRETKEIFIKNWPKHNKICGPKVIKCVEKELKNVKSTRLIDLFLKECDKHGFTIDINMGNKYAKLYEQNIGLINGVVKDWLIDISEKIDAELFKRAIEIATDKGKCNKGYINGIINQWVDNNIKTINDLKAYEISIKNKGENNSGNNKQQFKNYEHAFKNENEDESIYSKPTTEQLEAARQLLDGI